MKKIWILWGMWPQASLHFYQMLIKKTTNYYKHPRNQDYPNIILSNIPVPDLIKWENSINITVTMVNKEAKKLEKFWVNFLVMPCNTMHLFKEEIMKWIQIPFISMIDCVVSSVKKTGIKKVWLLWSSTTMQSSLYSLQLQNTGIQTIIPEINKHNDISTIIQKYISWNITQADIDKIDIYCQELMNSWAEWIILWCTELPLIMKPLFGKYNLFSSSEILSDLTLHNYYKT